jgi:uncharacterized protein YfaS (alpha-2-macroglobulin family)
MYWQPQLITDDDGHASIELDLADSITTWRLSGSAVTADGRLGSVQTGIRVFQPFFVDLNLPVALTRNDEIDVPAVVSNFLPVPQTVELVLSRGDWFDLSGADVQTLNLKPKDVRSVSFRIKAKKAGRFELLLTAKGASLTDAVKRPVEVLPDGRRVESVTNGSLTRPVTLPFFAPADAIDGSAHAVVHIYPSAFSQLVEGLDAIFRLPTGCFEQTSSSLYPNVMALSYLRQTGKSVPEVEAKARQYIEVGAQRLVRFEVPGGGFDWYGQAPANILLTAYGLMEFRDMAAVHDVDPNLIDRTRRWLLSRRDRDGSWPAERRWGQSDDTELDRLRTTAYVAAAVFDGSPTEAGPTRRFLLSRPAPSLDDPYVIALVCHALLAIDPKDDAVNWYLDRLEALKFLSAMERSPRWKLTGPATVFHGTGHTGDIETTALAILAFHKAGRPSWTAPLASKWLLEQRTADGHWGSTQATVLALKALLAGSKPAGGGRRIVEIMLDRQMVQKLDIAADEAEVVKTVDLSPMLKPGPHSLTLRDPNASGIGFQAAFRYYVSSEPPPPRTEPFTFDLKLDRQSLTVNQTLTVTANITNRTGRVAPMVMADLPMPTGFALEGAPQVVAPTGPNGAQANSAMGRYELTGRQIIVYLRELVPNQPLVITYRLKPTVPATVAVPPGRVYEYYDPAKEARSKPSRLTVTPPGQAELDPQ